MIEALCVCLRAMQSIILYANETYDRGWLRLASPHLLPSFEPGPPSSWCANLFEQRSHGDLPIDEVLTI